MKGTNEEAAIRRVDRQLKRKRRTRKIFWVDLPRPYGEFENIRTYPTRAKAEKYLFEQYGMPRSVAQFFITEGRQ